MANHQHQRPTLGGAIRVELLAGGDVEQTWTLAKDEVRLGSSEVCDVCIQGLQRTHALLQVSGGRISVTPVAGAPIALNGAPVRHALTRPDDLLTLGRVRLRVAWVSAQQEQPLSRANQALADRPVLVVEGPLGRRRTLELRSGQLGIGCRGSHIRLRFPGVRENHATLHVEGHRVTLVARDGTVMRSGLDIRQCTLLPGEIVELGQVRLWLRPSAPTPPKPLQLHVPQHLLRIPSPPIDDEEDEDDPETVLMPRAREALFDGPPPPTVLIDADDTHEALLDELTGTAADTEPEPTSVMTSPDAPPGPPVLPPVIETGERAPHLAARVVQIRHARVVDAHEVWPGHPVDTGPLHCRVEGHEVLLHSRVPVRRGADWITPGQLRLVEGEHVSIDERGTSWRIDVYRPARGRSHALRWWALGLAVGALIALALL